MPDRPTYEVDVLIEIPTTIRVVADSDDEAREKALRGDGIDVTEVDYRTGGVVHLRRL